MLAKLWATTSSLRDWACAPSADRYIPYGMTCDWSRWSCPPGTTAHPKATGVPSRDYGGKRNQNRVAPEENERSASGSNACMSVGWGPARQLPPIADATWCAAAAASG